MHEPILRYVPPSGGPFPEDADAIARFDGPWLVRRHDGALILRNAEREEATLAPASCKGRVVRMDSARHRLLVACQKENGARVWRFGPGLSNETGEAYVYDHHLEDISERFVDLGDKFVDLDEGRFVAFRTPSSSVHGG